MEKLFKLKAKKEWIGILQEFHGESGMPVKLYDQNNNTLISIGSHNSLCEEIGLDNGADSMICKPSHRSLAELAKTRGKPVTDFCTIGMIKTMIPIYYGSEYVGGMTACGNRDPDFAIDAPYIADLMGYSLDDIALDEVAVSSYNNLVSLANKYFEKIHQIGEVRDDT